VIGEASARGPAPIDQECCQRIEREREREREIIVAHKQYVILVHILESILDPPPFTLPTPACMPSSHQPRVRVYRILNKFVARALWGDGGGSRIPI
jgi:hypothetical protein